MVQSMLADMRRREQSEYERKLSLKKVRVRVRGGGCVAHCGQAEEDRVRKPDTHPKSLRIKVCPADACMQSVIPRRTDSHRGPTCPRQVRTHMVLHTQH